MILTIIVEDKFVAINEVGYSNLNFKIDSNIHAVQWYGQKGDIEYNVNSDGTKPQNKEITSIDEFQNAIDAWNIQNELIINPPPPTEQQAKDMCVFQSKTRLQLTDYAMLPDVLISNKADFEQYRATVRQYIINPVTNPTFPDEPHPQWIAP
jgi:hypothetical protein